MAASANPSGDKKKNPGKSSINGVAGGGNPSNGVAGDKNPGNGIVGDKNPSNGIDGDKNSRNRNSLPSAEKLGPEKVLKHSPGLSYDWSMDEHTILEQALSKYASDPIMTRYSKISLLLQFKTTRDIAFRCSWMAKAAQKKESAKRRKEDTLTRKSKDKKEKVTDPSTKSSSHLAARPNVPPYALPLIPMDNDDGISYKDIGGQTGQLLGQNEQLFNQIAANISAYQIQENIHLFCQTRDNILKILNDLNDMPGVMKQMPPLPVKVNEGLAKFLPRTTLPKQS